jgi:ATP-dependent RNA helicase DeaD
MSRLFINIGKKDLIGAGDIVGAIAGEAGINADLIGNIKILDAFSFVEVPNEEAQNVISALSASNIKGKKVNVEIANEKSGGGDRPKYGGGHSGGRNYSSRNTNSPSNSSRYGSSKGSYRRNK